MAKVKSRTTGEKYRPTVLVKKVKKDIPTVIEVSGRIYTYQSPDQYRK